MDVGVSIFLVLVVLYCVIGLWLGRFSITMPMVFIVIGLALGSYGLGILPINPEAEAAKLLTELTLGLLLFADASTLNYSRVRKDAHLPGRLLLIGMPLTMFLGGIVIRFLVPGIPWGFAFLLGAILAPTDAALGLPIFNNPKVPVRIRRALNVESGLNDGIATPFVTFFLALAIAEEQSANGNLLGSALSQIVLACLIGAGMGLIGGRFFSYAARQNWMSTGTKQLGILGLALLAYFGSVSLGGNGFIAAFIGGIVFGYAVKSEMGEAVEYVETTGTFMSLLVWTIFGAAPIIPLIFQQSDWRIWLYALLSLTVIRMIPVAIAMLGLGLRRDTVGLMGWFGPRGLASVVFMLLALEELKEATHAANILVETAGLTILLSVMLHGLTAQPLANWYARRLAQAAPDIPELEAAPEPRTRSPLLHS